jgi:hypothetical protein
MLNPKTGNRWKVYVGIPSIGSVSDFQPHVLRELAETYKDDIELVYPKQLCQRIFHDAARNGIVDEFLETDCDILWMLDSDVCPPKHVLDIVSRYGATWEAAGSPYPVFMSQPGQSFRQIVFTVYKGINPEKTSLAPSACPQEGTDWVDGLATGCLFLKRSVFEKLEKPYFEFKYDPITRAPIQGEDLGFCLKLAKIGIQFFTDYSTVCKHFKNNICLLEMNNYCIDFANKSVENYDKTVRSQVADLGERFNRLVKENKELKEKLALRSMLKL